MNPQASDVVSVRLSAAGQAAGNGGPVTVHGASVSLVFTGAEAQDVHLAIWSQTLKTVSPFGKPWFELAPAAATAAAPAATTTSAK
jgi:hypothetical protein